MDINNNEEENKIYKELFEKYKSVNDMISEEDIREILNQYEKKLTSEQLSELIKKITGKENNLEITFEQFVKLIKSQKINVLDKKENEGISNIKLYIFILVLIITGSINTIINKIMLSTYSLNMSFGLHEKFITFCMFIGETLCFLFYYISERCFKTKKKSGSLINKKEKKEIKEPKIWYFLFPASLDILGSTISTIGLSVMSSSLYQMFRGALIIFVCIASIIFIKAKYYRHHFLGIFIVLVGLTIIGLNAVLKSKSLSGNNPGLGIFLVLLSQIFTCFQLIIEEKILKGYNFSELKAVGFEGLWGCLFYIGLLYIFYFIDCKSWPDNFKDNLCVKNDQGIIKFEDTIFAIRQIWEKKLILCYLLIFIFSIAFFNFSGFVVAKNVSSTLRSILDTMRTIIIWVFFLIMPFVPKDTKEYFSFIQLLGFIILVLGGLIYNEILVIPFCNFAENTKEVRKKKELLEKEIREMDKGVILDSGDD